MVWHRHLLGWARIRPKRRVEDAGVGLFLGILTSELGTWVLAVISMQGSKGELD